MKLKKCLCGGMPELMDNDSDASMVPGTYRVACPMCWTKTGYYKEPQNAVKAWNDNIKKKQTEPKHVIDLYTALALTNSLMNNNNVIYLRKENEEPTYRPSIILTLKEVKEKYDMMKVKVTNIQPYFCCEDYKGMLFTIKED